MQLQQGYGPLCIWRRICWANQIAEECLGDIDNEFYLHAETNMQAVRSQVEAIKPDFLLSTLFSEAAHEKRTKTRCA